MQESEKEFFDYLNGGEWKTEEIEDILKAALGEDYESPNPKGKAKLYGTIFYEAIKKNAAKAYGDDKPVEKLVGIVIGQILAYQLYKRVLKAPTWAAYGLAAIVASQTDAKYRLEAIRAKIDD